MGVENTIIIGRVASPSDDERMLLPTAIYTMRTSFAYEGPFIELIKASPAAPDVFWYPQLTWGPVNPDDPHGRQFGDCEMHTDPYDQPLTHVPIGELRVALEDEVERGEYAGFVEPLLAMVRVYEGRPRAEVFHCAS